MRIPKIISKDNREYILVKTYERYALYKDMITGINECFTYHELNMVRDSAKLRHIRKRAKMKLPKI